MSTDAGSQKTWIKVFLVAVLPPVLLTGLLWSGWLPPRAEGDTQVIGLARFIIGLTAIATLIGATIAALCMRKLIQSLPGWLVCIASLALAVLLSLLFDTTPNWPFADIGLVVSWTIVVTIMSIVLLQLAARLATLVESQP